MLPSQPVKPTIKVVLVEDKHEVRDNWAKLINSLPGFSCIQTFASGENALRVVPSLKPDVILMDILLPRMSGIDCTAQFKLLLPNTPVLMLTAMDDHELVFMALRSGADGYLLKHTKPEDLQAAIQNVLTGGAPMSSEIARCVIQSFRRPADPSSQRSLHLSAREEEVLILLTKGYSNKEISSQLAISVQTVGSHIKHIYEKMHVRSRAEAVARYMNNKP